MPRKVKQTAVGEPTDKPEKQKFWRVEIDDRHKIPVIKLLANQQFFPYGKDNAYPDYLVQLFNRSATHAAIVKHKVKFVCGQGLKVKTAPSVEAKAIVEKFLLKPNKTHEQANDILKKLELDYEIFNGFALEVVWSLVSGKVISVYHKPFDTLRVDSSQTGVWYSKEWTNQQSLKRWVASSAYMLPLDAVFIPFFNPDNVGADNIRQVYYFTEYTAQQKPYSMPEYIACNTDIEADIEIANYDLNNVKTGFAAGTMVTFFSGPPSKEEMLRLDRDIKGKMAGTDNAGAMLLNFQIEGATPPKIDQFRPNELADQYELLKLRVRDSIFIGHQVNNPMLFGIKTEGQLGGRTELIEAYEQFQNDYVSPRQMQIERCFDIITSNIVDEEVHIEILRSSPIGLGLSEEAMISVMTAEEIRERAGLPALQVDKEEVGVDQATKDAQAALKGSVGGVTGAIEIATAVKQGMISPEAAMILLQDLYGFTEERARQIANVPATPLPTNTGQPNFNTAFSGSEKAYTANDDAVILPLFAACGIEDNITGEDYAVEIESTEDAEAFEGRFQFARTPVLKITDPLRKIYDILAEQKKISLPDLAKKLSTSEKATVKMLNDLQRLNILDYKTSESGGDIEIIRVGGVLTEPEQEKGVRVTVLYKYNGPKDSKNRTFCAEMLRLNRLYTRQEIDNISEQVGYSVWLRRGGWYTDPNTGVPRPSCRHTWMQRVITEKI